MVNDRTRRWRQLYRLACRLDGSAGVHRGMTALTRQEWREISERRLALVLRETLNATAQRS